MAKLELVVLIVILTTVGNKIVLSWISMVTFCCMAVQYLETLLKRVDLTTLLQLTVQVLRKKDLFTLNWDLNL